MADATGHSWETDFVIAYNVRCMRTIEGAFALQLAEIWNASFCSEYLKLYDYDLHELGGSFILYDNEH